MAGTERVGGTVGVGSVSSGRPNGLRGAIIYGNETSALDVMSDENNPYDTIFQDLSNDEVIEALVGSDEWVALRDSIDTTISVATYGLLGAEAAGVGTSTVIKGLTKVAASTSVGVLSGIYDFTSVSIDSTSALLIKELALRAEIAGFPPGLTSEEIIKRLAELKVENALRGESPSEDTGPAGGPIPDDNDPDHSRPDRTDDTAAVVDAPETYDDWYTVDNDFGGNFGDGDTTNDGGWSDDGWTDPNGFGVGPVILDLDGDGVEVAFGEDIYFDLDDDGFLEQTSWAAADDGFLVIDKLANDVRDTDGSDGWGDGVIDQSNELVLSSLGLAGDTDLQALARYDDNGDGKLDAQDAIWNELKVWQDLNQDGKTEGDGTELKTLAAWGISSINIAYDDGTDFTDESNDVEVFGNILHGLASFTMNGTVVTGGVGDMTLAYNTRGWREVALTDAGGAVIGYSIEFEGDRRYDYAVVTASTAANFNLTALGLDGATGDDRNNVLNAAGSQKAVTISGGVGNDTLTGGWDDDLIAGGVGADVIRGNGGNDVLFFDAADTVVEGGEGVDVAYATEEDIVDANGVVTTDAVGVNLQMDTAGIEAVYGGDGDDTLNVSNIGYGTALSINGGKGKDVLTSGAADDTLSGDAGDDTLSGNAGDDTLIGGAGADIISGGSGADFILGGTEDDTLDAGVGDDFVLGGTGDDSIDGGSGDDYLDGGAGSDTIEGGNGDDFIIGGGGYDVISTGSGDDYVDAGAGNDTMTDSLGNDRFIGGLGDDLLNASTMNGKDVYFGGVGNDTVKLAGNASDYTWTYNETGGTGIGQYTVKASAGGAYSSLAGFLLVIQDVEHIEFDDQTVDLADVDVAVDNSGSFIEIADLAGAGGDGNDTYNGTVAVDTSNGWSGNDIMNGHGGSDVLTGGSGTDEVYGGWGADQIFGGSGSDTLVGGDGSDTIEGGSGSDTIIGDGKADSFTAELNETNVANGGGNDILSGGDGEDTILGGKGDDVIHGDDGADFVNAGTGNDTIYGDSGADQLYGGDGADVIHGGLGDDYIVADSGYSLNVTVHLVRFLTKGAEYKASTEARVAEVEAGAISIVDMVNSYLGDALGNTADGSTYTGSILKKITDSELSFTDFDFLKAVLPRIYGRAASLDETSFWQAKLTNGASYATVVMEAIEQAVVDPDKIQSAMVLFEEYTSAQVATLSFDDTVYGEAGDDEIYAGKGDDTVFGGTGHDKLHGGAGDDVLTGGSGSDKLLGGMGADTLIGGQGADVLEGGAGADVIHGDNELNTTAANPFDTLSYEGSDQGVNIDLAGGTASGGDAEGDSFDGIEWIAGSAYTDTLIGDAGANRLFGNGGRDTLNGGDGNDLLFGGTGNDTLNGEAGDDRLFGDSGSDTLSGGSGEDLLVGGAGDDILSGGYGNDVLVGDDGSDVFMLQNGGQDRVEDFTVGSDTIGLPSGLSFGDLTLTPAGINNTDTIVTYANTAANGNASLYLVGVKVGQLKVTSVTSFETGSSGADTIDFSNSDHAVSIDGRAGGDTIITSGNDDTIQGGTGADQMSGGAGDDLYIVNAVDVDKSSTSHNGIEVDLTDVFRGKFDASQPNTYNGYGAERAIDGDTSTFNYVKNAPLTIDLKTDFEITRIVVDNISWQSTSTHRILGATVLVLDKDEQVIESIVVTDLTDLDFAFTNAQNARFVRILPDNNSNSFDDYIHIEELQIFGYNKFENDTITETAGSDTIRVEGISSVDNISAETVGKDLILTLGGEFGNTITITDQWLDLTALKIEFLELSNGDLVDIRTFHNLGGNNNIEGTAGADTLHGYIGNDVIKGFAGNDTLNGGEGNDLLDGGVGADTLSGGSGDDYIKGGFDVDSADGGEGVDTIDVSHSSTGTAVDLAAGTVVWSGNSTTETATNFENAVGSQGADTILGTNDSNVLDGQDGNDALTGGLARDTLMGGAGDDVYFYNLGDGFDKIIEGDFNSNQTEVSFVNNTNVLTGTVPAGDGLQAGNGGAGINGQTYETFDNHQTALAGGNDRIVFGSGITQADLTFSDIGDDLFIHLPDGATITIRGFVYQKVETLEFADGSTMDLTNRGDVTWTGKEVGVFQDGIDNYFGGEGNDTLTANSADDTVQGGGGNDTISGGLGNDVLYGGAGNDTILGGMGSDTIYGDSGDDHIQGDGGTDFLDGGAGNDTLVLSSITGHLDIDLEAGISTPRFGADSGIVIESILNFENVESGSGNDIIKGTSGANIINGAAGDDIIEAGAGDDTLTGGTGANTFVFSRGDGMDTITDFNTATDTIKIEGAARSTIDMYSVTNNGSGQLITYGWDADGNPEDQILLVGVPDSAFSYEDIVGSQNVTVGTNGDDTYIGSDAHEYIIMNEGLDSITAGGGNDEIDAGAGFDIVHAGAGNDKVIGGIGADTIWLDEGDDVFIDDVETGSSGSDVVFGGDGDDLFLGKGGDDQFYGDAGSDTLNGGAGNDTLEGDTGIAEGKLIASFYRMTNTVDSVNDIPVLTVADGVHINGNLNVNVLAHSIGGRQDYYGVQFVGTIVVTAEGDYTFKTGSDDGSQLWIDGELVVNNDGIHSMAYQSGVVTGLTAGQHEIEIRYVDKTGGNTLEVTVQGPDTGAAELDIFASGMLGDAAASSNAPSGLGLEDTINGGEGNDKLLGGSGADILNGGAGIDTAFYRDSQSGLTIDLQNSSNNTGIATGDTYINVEDVYGSDFNDIISGDAGANRIWGWAGDDTLNGGDGDDILFGGNGADIMFGGLGDDTFYVDAEDMISQSVFESFNEGYDTVISSTDYMLTANVEKLVLTGGAASVGSGNNSNNFLVGSSFGNTLNGLDGDDVLWGNGGQDILNGGLGDDILIGGAGADTMNGGWGKDSASYVNATVGVIVDFQIISDNTGEAAGDTYSGIESLIGSSHDDTLKGNTSANTLSGSSGDDMLYGRDGDDTLIGGVGNDSLYGGIGADIFVFEFGSGIDTIADFTDGVDIIDLSATDLTYVNLTISGSGTGDVVISFDDGDATTALDELTLTNVAISQVTASDFIFA